MQSRSGVAAVCPHPNLLIHILPDFLFLEDSLNGTNYAYDAYDMMHMMHMMHMDAYDIGKSMLNVVSSQVKRSWPGLLRFSLGSPRFFPQGSNRY